MHARTSKRTKARAEVLSAIDERDVDFGHLWRQLEPHVEGVDMLVGEHTVLRFALEHGIIDADESGAGEDREGEREGDEREAPE
ncbi:hypothetical protein F441_13036 [Phytophthora nicotianae CJ01A1]|uniref:Uncharacterized protein n=2 Tax=Phytophthora nicotianae TaxID=4792 RepID=W2IM11_PHYNI|nr:hypothetical protein L916_12687 [Phytophthora nicotianae]ETL35156.1 hypothetical protein L916_12686 [Phytophthora nicotianae]ETL88395.1 hypothetical protein L917_12525 [Phytophthora nicotianae]ETP11457.1 hypothetical protein F441_13036 [Phytophthora nicotianae CJ01A1]